MSTYLHAQDYIDSTLNTLLDAEAKVDYVLEMDEGRTDFSDFLDVGISIARENNLDLRLAKCLHYRAFTALFEKDFELYRKLEDESIGIFLEKNDQSGVVNHYSSEAIYGEYQYDDQYKVDSIYKLAFSGFGELEQKSNQVTTLKNWSQFTFRKGRHRFADSLILEGERLLNTMEIPDVGFSLLNTKLIQFGQRGMYDSALVAGNKALGFLPEGDVSNFSGRLHLNLGNLNLLKENYEEAITHFVTSDSIFYRTELVEGQINAKGNIATLFGKLGQYDKGLRYARIALELAEKGGKKDLSMFHFRVGNLILSKDSTQVDEPSFHYNKALEYARKFKNQSNLINSLNGLSVIAKNQSRYDDALTYLNEALSIAEKTKNRAYFNLLYVKAKVLHLMGRYQESIRNNTIALSIENRNESERINLYQWLSDSHKQLGQYKIALEYMDRAYAVNDSVAKSVNFEKISAIETRYEAEKKEVENQLLIKDKQLQNATISKQNTAIISGGLALGLISLLSFFLYRQREKERQLNLDLAQQRDQISFMNKELNHRVKNNLAFMTSLLEMQGRRTNTEEARQVIKESESRLKALSLVHTNLFKNQHDTDINLKEYLIEIIDHLESIFSPVNRSLNIIHDFIDFTIDAEDAMRIGLIVNELVTNSVKHAFNEVENPEIAISTHLDEKGTVTLRYRDNGPGVQSKVITTAKQTESLGLKLVEILQKQLEDKVSLMFV